MQNQGLKEAITKLKKEHNVIPEEYSTYNGGFLFLAYPPNISDKENIQDPYFLVDLKSNKSGPFSPAFDLPGFLYAVGKMQKLDQR